MLEFTRKYGLGAVLALMAAITACSGPGQPAGQQDANVASREPETAAEQSGLEASEQDLMISLPDLGPAPEITNEVWLNTDKPLNLEAVRGRVVLVEFWTFG